VGVGLVVHQDVDLVLGEGDAHSAFLEHGLELVIFLAVDGVEVDVLELALVPDGTAKGPFVALVIPPVANVALVYHLAVLIFLLEWIATVSTVLKWLHRGELAEVASQDHLNAAKRPVIEAAGLHDLVDAL